MVALELTRHRDVEDIHALPAIAHYWSAKFLRPMFSAFGFRNHHQFFSTYAAVCCHRKKEGICRFASIESGDCEVEVALASDLKVQGIDNFRLECIDPNAALLDQGRQRAEEMGVADVLRFTVADITAWQPGHSLDLVIAYMSLHRFVELEMLFDKIHAALADNGYFLTRDVIGRNGHMRWPETLAIIQALWSELPDKYKYNHQQERLEFGYVNWDCSVDSLEGIRAQDILPLLIKRFHFDLFIGWGGLIDIFIDRGYGHNFNPNLEWDCVFIDYVHTLNEEKILDGSIKPTQMMAAMVKHPVEHPQLCHSLTPAFCVRDPAVKGPLQEGKGVLPGQSTGREVAIVLPRLDKKDLGDRIADLLRPLVRNGSYVQYFDLWEQHGFHVTRNHVNEVLPDMRTLPETLWEAPSPLAGIDMNEAEQLRLLRDVFSAYADEYNAFPHEKTMSSHQFYIENGVFGGTDALVLYCMMRHFRPRRVVDVGSLFSSLLIAQAVRRNDNDAEVLCIEPYPQDFIKYGIPGLTTIIEQKVQDVAPDVFSQLEDGDILFLDSSHVSKLGSDVNYLFFEVLPLLQPGVVVHLHDIFLPKEYPRRWAMQHRRFWNEQYLLRAFLMYNRSFEVLFGNSYMAEYHLEAMQEVFPNSKWWGGGSFWMRKCGPA